METREIYVLTVQRFYNGFDGKYYQMSDNRPVVGLYTNFEFAKAIAQECAQVYTSDHDPRYKIEKFQRCCEYEAAFSVLENETPVCVYTIRKHSIIS